MLRVRLDPVKLGRPEAAAAALVTVLVRSVANVEAKAFIVPSFADMARVRLDGGGKQNRDRVRSSALEIKLRGCHSYDVTYRCGQKNVAVQINEMYAKQKEVKMHDTT